MKIRYRRVEDIWNELCKLDGSRAFLLLKVEKFMEKRFTESLTSTTK